MAFYSNLLLTPNQTKTIAINIAATCSSASCQKRRTWTSEEREIFGVQKDFDAAKGGLAFSSYT